MKTNNWPIFAAMALAASILGHDLWAASPARDAPGTASNELRGVVKFEGTPPKSARINMSADPSCSKFHPGGMAADDLIADANGGLENVIVFVSQGLEGRTFQPPPQPVVIEQKGCMYVPHVVAMQANQKLEVINSDQTVHNIHPTPANNREWNKAQPPGSPLEETFAREEVSIPVHCNVHPWMRSYIAVFKHPYFAVTGKNGSFDLKDLPPGTYTLEAWHEKLGTATQKVVVGSPDTKPVEFVFKSGH
ncbi:MAG TPA: carboxypeptidase regulatory-like domain-containing protein [Terriglobales bacterium]|nr:carboxypeptidase regulatory-like domain-containing protein [Terriglobales bacterium]